MADIRDAGRQVGGEVASGATDAGKPVKVGGVYNTTPLALTNGQRGDAQVDAAGNLKTGVQADATTVGLDTHFSNAGTATATSIKASAGRLYALEVSNPNTTDVFLQLFDLATGSVTLGTTVPKQSFLVPAGASSSLRGAFDRAWTIPVAFATAITYAVTTTPTGNTAPGSNSTVNAEYK